MIWNYFLAVLDSWIGDLVNESVNDTYDLSISEFRALTIDQKDDETWHEQQENKGKDKLNENQRNASLQRQG